MRLIKIMIGLLTLGMLAYLIFADYPLVLLFLKHQPKEWIHVLLFNNMKFEGPNPIVILMIMGGLYLLVSLLLRFRTSTTYGSARFAGRRQAQRFTAPGKFVRGGLWLLRAPISLANVTFHAANAVLNGAHAQRRNWQIGNTTATSSFVLGRYHGQIIVLNERQQNEHLLMTVPTGGGKSSLAIIPNLLREQGSRSLFIADLVNELYPITAGAVARFHRVWLFAPTMSQESQGYNPLAYVTDARDAWLLADCWVKNTGEGKDPYWSNCARLLIMAVALHLRKVEPNAPFSRLSDIITTMPFEDLKTLLSASPSEPARRAGGEFVRYMALNERLVGSIMTDMGNRFQVLHSDEIRAVTATNEIDFCQMIEEPTALYLSIPSSETEFYRPLLACFTMQMFRIWQHRVEHSHARKLPLPVACYLDEFSNIGSIPDFPNFISTARHFTVALFLAIQNFSQMETNYGKQGAETIMNNARTHLVFPGAGLRETEYYSKRIGETTVRTQSRSSASSGSTYSTWTEGEARRPLMTPDEIRTMPSGTILMVPSASAPLLLRQSHIMKIVVLLVLLIYHITQHGYV